MLVIVRGSFECIFLGALGAQRISVHCAIIISAAFWGQWFPRPRSRHAFHVMFFWGEAAVCKTNVTADDHSGMRLPPFIHVLTLLWPCEISPEDFLLPCGVLLWWLITFCPGLKFSFCTSWAFSFLASWRNRRRRKLHTLPLTPWLHQAWLWLSEHNRLALSTTRYAFLLPPRVNERQISSASPFLVFPGSSLNGKCLGNINKSVQETKWTATKFFEHKDRVSYLVHAEFCFQR